MCGSQEIHEKLETNFCSLKRVNVFHQTVMPVEVVDILTWNGTQGGLMVDATLGGGGHSEALLRSRPDIQIIGLDQDRDAIQAAEVRLKGFGERFRAVHLPFHQLTECLEGKLAEGVVMDLGVSSHQLETPERGFSFQWDGPLDMRMNLDQLETAADVVNRWKEEDLAQIFWELGEERFSRRIARAVVEVRKDHWIKTTKELADLVGRVVKRSRTMRIHPATRVFQALRIQVNDELNELEGGLKAAWKSLKRGGRWVMISFHSLEDRMVKHQFRKWALEEKAGTLLSKKPMIPTEKEIQENPRSRSAKLRAIEKI